MTRWNPDAEAVKAARVKFHEERMARYRRLRANVRRRRRLYGFVMVLVLAVLVFTLVDIFVLDAGFGMTVVLPAYIALFVIALLLLISRGRHAAEVEEIKRLERSLLQCPDCENIFRFGSVHWHDHKLSAFSCPVCGVYSKLPPLGSPPVEAFVPESEVRELDYRCGNCREEFVVGTFTGTPLHEVKFRTCPNCEKKGFIERVGSSSAA